MKEQRNLGKLTPPTPYQRHSTSTQEDLQRLLGYKTYTNINNASVNLMRPKPTDQFSYRKSGNEIHVMLSD